MDVCDSFGITISASFVSPDILSGKANRAWIGIQFAIRRRLRYFVRDHFMPATDQLERQLEQWTKAGVIDASAAGRIREFESAREGTRGVRWPVVFAVAFGSIMVAAGVLLFVAAHWENLSPTQRFLLVVALIAGFHVAGGVLMPRMRALGMALHAIGTVALGGGIFLGGQIFNLQEHWPGGILLWAIGAVLAWVVLRDWLQATLSALLIPAWIACEWIDGTERYTRSDVILAQFLTLLAIAYLSARRGSEDSAFRRALMWCGGLALLPASAFLVSPDWHRTWIPMPAATRAVGFVMAFVAPLVVAWILRGRGAVWNAGYALWAFAIPMLHGRILQEMCVYLLYIVGAVGLVVWGLREQRRERINLGVAGFAITILVFYFDNVMGKLGRSAALVGFGLLFLLGGWTLEKLRRRLVARTRVAPATGGAA